MKVDRSRLCKIWNCRLIDDISTWVEFCFNIIYDWKLYRIANLKDEILNLEVIFDQKLHKIGTCLWNKFQENFCIIIFSMIQSIDCKWQIEILTETQLSTISGEDKTNTGNYTYTFISRVLYSL